MNRELCLVICFFVGVLVFYLLKQSCGCKSTVVEGAEFGDFIKDKATGNKWEWKSGAATAAGIG